MTLAESASFSNWRDIVSGAIGSESAAAAARSMLVRYDETVLQQSAATESMALAALRTAAEASTVGCNATWDRLRPFYPPVASLRKEWAHVGGGLHVDAPYGRNFVHNAVRYAISPGDCATDKR